MRTPGRRTYFPDLRKAGTVVSERHSFIYAFHLKPISLVRIMLLGFAPNARMATDVEILGEMKCERIFSASDGFYTFEDIAGYLRPGDTLAVVSLLRLSHDMGGVVHIVDLLHRYGVSLCIPGTQIESDRKFAELFVDSCSILAELFPADPKSEHAIRRRGRPAALPLELHGQVKHLLAKHHSVADVARMLNVSPATIYRYFPRSKPELGNSPHDPSALHCK